jgi:hypothetical protein
LPHNKGGIRAGTGVSQFAWLVVTVIVLLLLVPAALWLGRMIWSSIEPGDDDPGGRESPPPQLDPNVWTGTPFVDVLREGRRLKEEQRNRQKNDVL